MEALDIMRENAGRAKLKCELSRLKINYYFSEDIKSLERKLAYARTHRLSFFDRVFKAQRGLYYEIR